MRHLIAALFLAACRPTIFVEAADADAGPIVAALVADAKADGSHVVVRDRPGVTVVVDPRWISNHNVAWQSCSVGFFEPIGKVVYLASTVEFSTCIDANGGEDVVRLTERGAKLNLAHELGHVGGLQHVAHGLMAPYDNTCVGRETECLAAALSGR